MRGKFLKTATALMIVLIILSALISGCSATAQGQAKQPIVYGTYTFLLGTTENLRISADFYGQPILSVTQDKRQLESGRRTENNILFITRTPTAKQAILCER